MVGREEEENIGMQIQQVISIFRWFKRVDKRDAIIHFRVFSQGLRKSSLKIMTENRPHFI